MQHSDTSVQASNIEIVVLLTGLFFAFLACSVIYFVVLYRNRQLKNKQEQEEREASFRQELLKTQLEVQEQTFENVSKEIHDNITQVLSFVKLTLATVNNSSETERKTKIGESRELIANTITDLRDLSKSLSFEHVKSVGLAQTIQKEVDRINKSGTIKAILTIDGEEYQLGDQAELVLFRIFQEALNNTLKHAAAKHFKIILQYYTDLFNLTLEDDGLGFSSEILDNKAGSGLRNMQNRAVLVGGKASIESSPGKGCRVMVTIIPVKNGVYIDGGSHPDSVS